ncbi:MAG: multidrug transporter [Streptococcaceae bacterium]|jgi:PTS system N-acetylgalactosamine-specific IIA component|nr:multidrug transporter [Streptococcaceae bacterium]
MKIIVTGHGHFATGLESTVKLLAGEIPGVDYIDFLETMSEADLLEKLPSENNLVFFCDLAGGTPYKLAALRTTQADNNAVMAGGNIAALLEIGLQYDLLTFKNAQELVNLLTLASHNGIQKFKSVKYSEKVDEEDGI